MARSPNAPRLRLPERLVYTALRVTVAGTVACSVSSGEPLESKDAAADGPTDGCAAMTDAPSGGSFSDACAPGEQIPCMAQNQCASCPAYVCNPMDCNPAAGCEPII